MSLTVAGSELLARFLVFRGWFSPQTNRVKPDAFIPHPYRDLSVSRHIDLTKAELWDLGREVAWKRNLTLHARGDILASDVRAQRLDIEPSEPPRNHASINGWPKDKPAQKIIALEIAAQAKLVMVPDNRPS